jgi:hypothetical protein
MEKILGLNFFVFSILVLFVVLYFSKEVRDEGFVVEAEEEMEKSDRTEAFGTSPGTMDQLASTRVVSPKEQSLEDQIYNNLTEQGIINLTETGYKGTDFASTALE